MTVYHKPSKATKVRPTSGLAPRCACNEKKKLVALYGNASGFPIRSLQEKMEKQSFNTINPDNIAYVSTRMLPSAKSGSKAPLGGVLGGIANFIQGNEAKFGAGKARQAVKNQSSEINEIKQKDLKEHIKQHKAELAKRIKQEKAKGVQAKTPKSAKQRRRLELSPPTSPRNLAKEEFERNITRAR